MFQSLPGSLHIRWEDKMSRPGNLCICILCFVLLVGTVSAATAFTNFVANGNVWQPPISPILPIIANRLMSHPLVV